MSTQINEKPHSTFEDLEVYQLAREFRKTMYRVAKRLPDIEKFGLASQTRRAALSLTNNIAEGHGRFHYLDQIKFTLQSRGSLEELIDDLNVCEDEQYLPVEEIVSSKRRGLALAAIDRRLHSLPPHPKTNRRIVFHPRNVTSLWRRIRYDQR